MRSMRFVRIYAIWGIDLATPLFGRTKSHTPLSAESLTFGPLPTSHSPGHWGTQPGGVPVPRHNQWRALMIIDAAELDATHAYKLLIGSIIPRAVAWVSTVSPEGVANLAPISFFTAVSRKPPMVSLTLQPQADGVTLKDTFVNIRDPGEFVTNLVTLPQVHAMHDSA